MQSPVLLGSSQVCDREGMRPQEWIGTLGDASESIEFPDSPEPSWLITVVPSPLLDYVSISLSEDHAETSSEVAKLMLVQPQDLSFISYPDQ